MGHLLRVPFENLDIHRGVPIVLDLDMIIEKVVARRRGGYCYELNSAFGALLTTLGYDVDLVAARVARDDGGFSQEFAHMALLVPCESGGDTFLVDVGFGDAFTKPLPLTDGVARLDRDRKVRLVRADQEWAYQEDRGDGWQTQYKFAPEPRRLEDFHDMNEWQQSSPDSHFTSQTVCSVLTVEGRATISGGRLIITRDGHREERELPPTEIEEVLRTQFGVVLE
jgi:N-hydroxyarylamine O-acetyltransferase